MGNYDSKLSKVIIALLLILVGIIICFPIAYNNMPKTHTETSEQYGEEFITEDKNEDNAVSEDNEQDDTDIEHKNSKKHYKANAENEDDNNLEPIEEMNGNQEHIQTEPEQNENIFTKADKLKKEKNYNQAISEYESIAENAEDNVKAQCYENIASTYAITKRYGTALSFAQKAYNLLPNTSREFLLARLYYKTGRQDKANGYIKEILNRDFDRD